MCRYSVICNCMCVCIQIHTEVLQVTLVIVVYLFKLDKLNCYTVAYVFYSVLMVCSLILSSFLL
jgi:K+ transporter